MIERREIVALIQSWDFVGQDHREVREARKLRFLVRCYLESSSTVSNLDRKGGNLGGMMGQNGKIKEDIKIIILITGVAWLRAKNVGNSMLRVLGKHVYGWWQDSEGSHGEMARVVIINDDAVKNRWLSHQTTTTAVWISLVDGKIRDEEKVLLSQEY